MSDGIGSGGWVQKNGRVATVSRWTAVAVAAVAYGFERMCDVIVYSHEEGVLKPDPRSYAIVCERLGVAPEHAVFVDNVAANVDGARATGMQGILFVSAAQAIGELQTLLRGA